MGFISLQIGFESRVVVDGVFLTEHPRTSLRNGNFKKCPMIYGYNKDEGARYVALWGEDHLNFNTTEPPFISADEFDEVLRTRVLGYKNELIIESFKNEYVDCSKANDVNANYFDEYSSIIGDNRINCPSNLEITAHAAAAESDVYQYYFTHNPSSSNLFWFKEARPKWMGATHTEETLFVFGAPFDPPFYFEGYEYPEEEKLLSYNVIKYWTNFARTG